MVYAILNHMSDSFEKPFTIKDVHEVLIPAMEATFATKENLGELEAKMEKRFNQLLEMIFANQESIKEFRTEMEKRFDELLTVTDKILKDIETLMTEKAVSYHQKKKEQKM